MADESGPRRDLAAMLHPLTRALVAAELPVLADHGISMWGYVVLNALDGGPARTQAAIQANEERVLARLSPADRQAFLRAVRVLSALPQEEITGA